MKKALSVNSEAPVCRSGLGRDAAFEETAVASRPSPHLPGVGLVVQGRQQGVQGLLLGAEFTVVVYLVWNEVPTVVGNLVGGLLFTGLAIYLTHGRTAAERGPADAATVTPAVEESPEHELAAKSG